MHGTRHRSGMVLIDCKLGESIDGKWLDSINPADETELGLRAKWRVTVMRWYGAIISLLLLSSTVVSDAQAQTTELTLSCNGKSKDNNIEEPIINMEVVVNLTKNLVTGLAIVANIYKVDNDSIFFEGMENDPIASNGPIRTIIRGDINRITGGISGELKVIWGTETYTTNVHLICTPTRQFFSRSITDKKG
jgi:hypothetical protein